jgi:hypothetical protein
VTHRSSRRRGEREIHGVTPDDGDMRVSREAALKAHPQRPF